MTKKTNEKNYIYKEVMKALKQEINFKIYSTAESFANETLHYYTANGNTMYFKGRNIVIVNDESIHSAKFTILEMRAMRNMIKDYISDAKSADNEYEVLIQREIRKMAEERLNKK